MSGQRRQQRHTQNPQTTENTKKEQNTAHTNGAGERRTWLDCSTVNLLLLLLLLLLLITPHIIHIYPPPLTIATKTASQSSQSRAPTLISPAIHTACNTPHLPTYYLLIPTTYYLHHLIPHPPTNQPTTTLPSSFPLFFSFPLFHPSTHSTPSRLLIRRYLLTYSLSHSLTCMYISCSTQI
ncbi:hypothetical protein EJ05DRAFT_477173 [Pseudovirgaria hyperparasitica]|uniref:Uncharacterized protein n=1 Tax=Pseudovirgaria hyperparasitica TaxID=470096 RepID=A0A6A6W2Y1_9PEZI|nr:uncharacterized protein EJ05DRAFT_477173 [Pseudovirgaria hyperparasitica]KAF2756953.1 hypothetical protein EJ05DRAFT_477173 [Pseudovirgaria hyperparasitica]